MINEAKVAFCAGYEFGKQGEAFSAHECGLSPVYPDKGSGADGKGDQRSVASVIPVNDTPCEIRNFLKEKQL